jgi:hypothetical protein
MEVLSLWLQVFMDYTFKLEQFSFSFVSFDLLKDILLDSITLDLKRLLDIDIDQTQLLQTPRARHCPHRQELSYGLNTLRSHLIV